MEIRCWFRYEPGNDSLLLPDELSGSDRYFVDYECVEEDVAARREIIGGQNEPVRPWQANQGMYPVSYTHLTLPTKRIV